MILQDKEYLAKVENEIFSAPVPMPTESYAPVSHRNVVNAILEQANKRGFEIASRQYWSNRGGNQVTGKFNIVVPGNDELGMMVAFRNSYDKTMSLGFAAGGNVWICTNGMVSGDITLVRRHTGSIVKEINEKIEVSMNDLEEQFNKFVIESRRMKEIEMSKTAMAELVGKMFVEHDLINTVQLNIIKNEINDSEAFKDDTLWSFYNHITESYKKSHAYHYIDNHIDLHHFVETEFELV